MSEKILGIRFYDQRDGDQWYWFVVPADFDGSGEIRKWNTSREEWAKLPWSAKSPFPKVQDHFLKAGARVPHSGELEIISG